MVIERASLTVGQKLLRSRLGPLAARLSNQRSFRAQFARIFSDAHPLSDEDAADQWALLADHVEDPSAAGAVIDAFLTELSAPRARF